MSLSVLFLFLPILPPCFLPYLPGGVRRDCQLEGISLMPVKAALALQALLKSGGKKVTRIWL